MIYCSVCKKPLKLVARREKEPYILYCLACALENALELDSRGSGFFSDKFIRNRKLLDKLSDELEK